VHNNFATGAKVRMCTEYAENGLQVRLHRARHVFDEMASWQPCTGARPHGRRAFKLCATRCLAPCCSKTERLCVSLPPSLASAHPGALPPRARTPERDRHGCRRRAHCHQRCCGPLASRCPATHSLPSTALSLALRAPPRPFFAVVAPSPSEQPPALCLLAWPGHIGSPGTSRGYPWVHECPGSFPATPRPSAPPQPAGAAGRPSLCSDSVNRKGRRTSRSNS